jgi:hypothetical protein
VSDNTPVEPRFASYLVISLTLLTGDLSDTAIMLFIVAMLPIQRTFDMSKLTRSANAFW